MVGGEEVDCCLGLFTREDEYTNQRGWTEEDGGVKEEDVAQMNPDKVVCLSQQLG